MYASVHREWVKGKEARQEMSPKPICEQIRDAPTFMMQRWQQETICNQPYHNIGAVKRLSYPGFASQTSYQRYNDSSVKNFEYWNGEGATQSHELRATHLNGCIGVSLGVILCTAFLNACRESLILLASKSYIKPSFPVRARLPLQNRNVPYHNPLCRQRKHKTELQVTVMRIWLPWVALAGCQDLNMTFTASFRQPPMMQVWIIYIYYSMSNNSSLPFPIAHMGRREPSACAHLPHFSTLPQGLQFPCVWLHLPVHSILQATHD